LPDRPGRSLTAAAFATTAALSGGTLEAACQLVLELDTDLLERAQGAVVKQLGALLDAADALVQRLVFLGQAGKLPIRLAQAVQLGAQFGEILDQRVVFDVHERAPETMTP